MIRHINFCPVLFSLIFHLELSANLIVVNPTNYQLYLDKLLPGDTLFLSSGIYLGNLPLKNVIGTDSEPIVIKGAADLTIFQGQSCCNTISLTKCSYLVICDLKLNGLNQFVDAIKAEGTEGNWADHITIENISIVNYAFNQQSIGISTKCSAWNWIIRKNRISQCGTGMYLGNSDGTKPFVNGIIENNLITGSIGYNIEIKHQLNGVRDDFNGTRVNGFTLIRNNVFSKDSLSSTSTNARPNLLVGGFPTSGWGSNDYYEIVGNFFYNNPVEALFQGTGNLAIYDNIFVNHYDPKGFRAVYITSQNGIKPQNIYVFHNTVWTANSDGAIRLYNQDINYKQYCYANAVFSEYPITNFKDTVSNIVSNYASAKNYVLSATTDITKLNLYPKSGQLKDKLVSSIFFEWTSQWNQDFNQQVYDWSYIGAYSGCCVNNGWKLALDNIPYHKGDITKTDEKMANLNHLSIYPNPAKNELYFDFDSSYFIDLTLYDEYGSQVHCQRVLYDHPSIDISHLKSGIYILQMYNYNHSKVSNVKISIMNP